MANFTKKTEKSADFAKGGNTPMFGGHGPKTGAALQAGDQAPGTTAHDNSGGGGDKFASGGSGKMFGYTGVQPARGGITSAR